MNVFDLVAKISLDPREYEAGLKKAGGQMKGLGNKMSAFGATMTKKVTMPIVALAAASVKSFNDVKKGLNIVTQKTGATGKALEDMHQSVKNLASDIPATFEEIGTAVGEVSTRFGIAGQELEDLSGQFVKFAKVNGTDVNNSIDTTQKALAAFGLEAKDASGLLDTMTKVGQDTGVSMDTLMNGLVQNGTALQELGLSIEQSVNLMGQLDKSGANSETVMQGLRRALKNAAKDGVPLDKALTDLQKSIKGGKDGMDGLTTAYELFGRSGDQIYGAVKNGTIDFTKLGDAVADAGGTLDKTFEATLTPAEKFQRTLNTLKTTGYEFGNTALSMLTPAIEKISQKAKELSEKWQNLDSGTKEMILKFMGIAAVVGPVITIVGKLTTAIGGLVKGIGGAVSGLTAMLSGTAGIGAVFGAAAVAVVAVVGAVAAYSAVLNAAAEKAYGFSDAEKKQFKALEETTEAYNKATEARDKAIEGVQNEYGRIESLRSEYNSYIDSSGKVKKGYEDRAAYIKGELCQALGIEEEELDKLIDKNGKLEQKISDVIAMKKSQAILEAGQDAYQQALEDEKNAAENLVPALKALDEKKAQYAQAEKEYQEKQAEYNKQMEHHGRVSQAYTDELDTARTKWLTMGEAVKKGEKTVEDYKNTLGDAHQTIKNQEGLMEAVAKKDYKAMEKYNKEQTEGIKTRLSATKDELEQQAQMYDENYKYLYEKRKGGDESITKTMVKEAKKRRKSALEEAGYTEKTWNSMQKKVSDSASKAQKNASSSSKKMKDDVNKSTSSMASNASTNSSKMATSVKKNADKAASSVKGAKKTIQDIFPINIGKTLTGKLVSIITEHKKDGNVTQRQSLSEFAKAYDTPWLFNSPTILAGDRGGTGGGEVMYGRNKLMRDVGDAVKKNASGNVTINLNYTAGQDANDMLTDIARGIKRYKMAGVI